MRDGYKLPGYIRLEHNVKHNSKLKLYPDGNHNLTVASKPIFKEKGWEESGWKPKIPKPKSRDGPIRDNKKLL